MRAHQLGFGAVLVAKTVRTDTAAVPAICQLNGQCVAALPQQICNVIGLVLHALAVIDNAGAGTKPSTVCPLTAA